MTVRVRKSLTGEVTSTTPEAKVTKTARGLRDVNSRAVSNGPRPSSPARR